MIDFPIYYSMHVRTNMIDIQALHANHCNETDVRSTFTMKGNNITETKHLSERKDV